MATETKNISNTTSVTQTSNSISIFTEYLSNTLPNILKSLIGQIVGSQDSTPYIEGELVIQAKNMPTQIDVNLSSGGELILLGDSCELKGYSIIDGYLIYTG